MGNTCASARQGELALRANLLSLPSSESLGFPEGTVISLQALLRGLWMSGVRSKDEVRVLLERIKAADALEVSPEVEMEIFGDSENDELDSH